MIPQGLLDLVRTYADGQIYLSACAWHGGYDIVYYDMIGEAYCHSCATKILLTGSPLASDDKYNTDMPVDAYIYWEGPDMECALCSKVLEAAYGDPEQAEGEES